MLDRLFRLVVVLAILGAATAGAWWYYTATQAARLQQELARLQAEMDARLAEKEAMIGRLSRDHRKAVIEVRDQTIGEGGEVVDTTLEFIEVDDEGRELGRLTATVPGDTIYVNAWVAKFDRGLVAEGHPLMGRTLVLLRSISSARMAPDAGVPIDTPGAIPVGYAAADAAAFEKRLWESFWAIASDPQLAKSFGVRVAQGEAVFRPVRKGESLDLLVEAAGGMSLVTRPERSKGS